MANPKETATLPSQEKITVEQISPIALAAFLSRQTGKDFPRDNYRDIFTSLRKTALPQQERLLVNFFTERVEGFPHGEELGKELAKINNIHWFQPKQEPEQGVLEQLTQTYLERLYYDFPSKPSTSLKIIKEDWQTAWETAGDAASYTIRDKTLEAARDAAGITVMIAARDAAWDAAGETAWDAARSAARSAAGDAVLIDWDAARSAAGDAAKDARWTIVGDLMPTRGYAKGNPFEPLMEIYESGCWPIGLIEKNNKREFVVFVPLAVSPKTV